MADPNAPITPVPLPTIGEGGRVDPSVRTVLVVGGSFDPPHKAHVHLPLMAARHLEARLDEPRGVWLLYVPAARSPFKKDGPRATDAQRIEMLTLATGHLPRCAVWTDEIDRAIGGAPSYTVDTLRRLREWLDAHGGDEVRVRLLVGADQAAALDRWREAEAVVALAEPLVMARAGDDPSRFPQALGDWTRRLLPTPMMDASSTAVRAAAAAGDFAALAKMLDASVLKVIQRDGLYQPSGSE
ncbi:MAG: nicotinate-nicotinamide nucleotide adenylyltransferase [Phycisphaerales bacterium]